MSAEGIRAGGYQSDASVHTRAVDVLARELGDRAPEVPFHFERNVVAAGRRAADLLSMVETGELTLCYFSASYLAARAPELGVLDLPFAVTDRARAYAALDGELGRRLADAIERVSGYTVLGWLDNGFRHVSNRLRAIRSPADCRGLRIRTLSSRQHDEFFRALGFEPVPLDVKDLVPAVELGTVDAQDNPLTNIVGFGIHEHHRHITLTGHFFGVAVLLCHRASFEAWSAATRDAVMASAVVAVEAQRRMAALEDEAMLDRLAGGPVEVVRLEPAERARFVEAAAPVSARHRAALAPELLELLHG